MYEASECFEVMPDHEPVQEQDGQCSAEYQHISDAESPCSAKLKEAFEPGCQRDGEQCLDVKAIGRGQDIQGQDDKAPPDEFDEQGDSDDCRKPGDEIPCALEPASDAEQWITAADEEPMEHCKGDDDDEGYGQ